MHVVALPADPKIARIDTVGPIVLGDTAVVGSSQLGFVAVDIARGHIAWKKPAGTRVAPPVATGDGFLLVADCTRDQSVPAGERLLGCVRAVNPTGSDLGYLAIHGPSRELAGFAVEPGAQAVWSPRAHTLIWRRGALAVTIDTLTGAAGLVPGAASDPPLVVHYKQRTWHITRGDDGLLIATDPSGKASWRTTRAYGTLLGAIYLPEQSPMVRVSRAGRFAGSPELLLFDIDATGSLHGQVALPVPGTGLIGHAVDAVGNTALAVQLDASQERDFIVGYAANALIMWVYPLPRQPRPDPVGLAVAPEAVVVFHDGDTVTVLPELSAPPTAPGAARVPSDFPTP